jgi:hypothetical protein
LPGWKERLNGGGEAIESDAGCLESLRSQALTVAGETEEQMLRGNRFAAESRRFRPGSVDDPLCSWCERRSAGGAFLGGRGGAQGRGQLQISGKLFHGSTGRAEKVYSGTSFVPEHAEQQVLGGDDGLTRPFRLFPGPSHELFGAWLIAQRTQGAKLHPQTASRDA